MRLIDADALTILLHDDIDGLDEEFPNDKQVKPYMCGVKMALSFIETAPTIETVPRWIPCDERLPKDLEVVNITWINHRPVTYYAIIKDKPFTATAIHYKDKWWWYSPICEDLLAECGKSECDKMDADIEVTAWMPLPEPYYGERKDDDGQR